MYASLSQVIVMASVPSVLFGIVGTVTGSKKIQMPEIDVAISR
jgi:hypothetical protein